MYGSPPFASIQRDDVGEWLEPTGRRYGVGLDAEGEDVDILLVADDRVQLGGGITSSVFVDASAVRTQ